MKFATVLILLISISLDECKNYAETSFPTLPNLYMEYLGDVKFFHETYNVISYINLDELTWEESEISKGLTIIENLCSKNCSEKNLIKRMRNQLDIVRKDKYKIFSSIGVPTLFRDKRGVFDFVGKISKILFGTMSEDDAKYYNDEIDAVHRDNKRIGELFRNQTQILQLSLQKTENLFKEYSKTFQEINSNFESVDKNIRKLEQEESKLQKDSIITEMCLEIELALMSLDRSIGILFQSLTFAKTGQINPQLLSPDILMSSIKLIRDERGNKEMPIMIENGNYYEYLEISDVTIAVIKYRLVYIIKIPILELGNFKAYRVIPAPKLIKDNILAYISTPDDYIITNDEKLLYTPSDKHFLESCKIHENNHICKSIYPKYNIKLHDACLSKIVNEPFKLKDDDCNIKLVSVMHTMWIQLKNNNEWLYAAPQPDVLKIMCNNTVEDKQISGTKKLWISPGCSAISNDVILQSHIEKIIDNDKAFIPLITHNFSESFEVFKDPHLNLSLIKIHTIETPDIKIGDLTKYGTRLSEIRREAIEIGNHERTKTLYENAISWITYVLYALGSLVVLYIIIKFKIFSLLKCLICGVFHPCTRIYNKCLLNYGDHNSNRNSGTLEMNA